MTTLTMVLLLLLLKVVVVKMMMTLFPEDMKVTVRCVSRGWSALLDFGQGEVGGRAGK